MPIKAILAFSYGITLTKLFLKIFLDETPYFFISNSEISILDVSESVLKKCADFFKDFFAYGSLPKSNHSDFDMNYAS